MEHWAEEVKLWNTLLIGAYLLWKLRMVTAMLILKANRLLVCSCKKDYYLTLA